MHICLELYRWLAIHQISMLALSAGLPESNLSSMYLQVADCASITEYPAVLLRKKSQLN
jgi:hypothetical protein